MKEKKIATVKITKYFYEGKKRYLAEINTHDGYELSCNDTTIRKLLNRVREEIDKGRLRRLLRRF